MTAMTIIIAVVIFWALFVVGVLVGISVHRDGRRHHGLVAILTLEGSARLRQCSDREGTTVRSWDAAAGHH